MNTLQNNYKKSSIIIEFIGQAGAGKTTVAKELIDYVKLHDYSCPSLEEIHQERKRYGVGLSNSLITKLYNKLLWKIPFCIFRHPIIGGVALLNCIFTYPQSRRGWRNIAYTCFYYRYMKIMSQKGYDFIVFDEAVMHLPFMLRIMHLKKYSKFFAKMKFNILFRSIPRYIVYVTVDSDVALQRLRVRNKKQENSEAFLFGKNVPIEEAKKLYYKYKLTSDYFVNNAVKLYPENFIILDTEHNSIEECIENIAKSIKFSEVQL